MTTPGLPPTSSFAEIAERLSETDDEELLGLALANGTTSVWSTTGVAEVAGHRLFVKRVPLTAAEAGAPYSTRNHYGLPDFYHYGVGSAGFGAFRELAAHQTTTEWVLSGAAPGFPLLYHHRVLPGRPGPWREGRMTVEDYVAYWAGSDAVSSSLQARFAARQELWLFLEYFPYMALDWLVEPQNDVEGLLGQICAAAAALRDSEIVHFDAHLGNVVADGSRAVLTDFGLVSSAAFDIEVDERAFIGRHRHYDIGVILASLGLGLAVKSGKSEPAVKAEVDRVCGLGEGVGRLQVFMGLIDHAADISELLDLSPAYLAVLERYRDVNHYMHSFITEMQSRPSKDALYDDAELLSRLRLAGAPFID
jgi:serine/threonine protein kinase